MQVSDLCLDYFDQPPADYLMIKPGNFQPVARVECDGLC